MLAAVRTADLSAPTPCAAWDLRGLLGHMIGQNHGFAAATEAPDAPLAAFAERPPDPDRITDDWQASADRLTTAFASAELTEQVLLVEISAERRFPAVMVVGFQMLDTVVHAWDVATALGQPFRPDDELVAAVLAQAQLVPGGEFRTAPGAPFAPALTDGGADDWARTLALLGRDVAGVIGR